MNRFLKDVNRKQWDVFPKNMEEKAKHKDGNANLLDVDAKHKEGNRKLKDVFGRVALLL